MSSVNTAIVSRAQMSCRIIVGLFIDIVIPNWDQLKSETHSITYYGKTII